MDKIREALEPFARMAEEIGPSRPLIRSDSDVVYGFGDAVLTLGDFKLVREALALLDAPVTSDAREVWERIEAFSENLLSGNGLAIFNRVRDIEPTKTMLAREREFAATLIEAYAAERERKAREETARKCAEAAYQAAYELDISKEDRAYIERAIMEAAK